MEQEQLEDLSELNNTVPDARPAKKVERILISEDHYKLYFHLFTIILGASF